MKASRDNDSGIPGGARLIFGIFMVLFYIAVGLLFIFNVFSIYSTGLSCTIGGILCAYGIWRGIRMYLRGR